MSYPKVWGDRSNTEARIVAEARERGLQGVNAPYLSAVAPGFRADKRGAFSEVTLEGHPPDSSLARIDAGFIFRRMAGDTFWGMPNTTNGSPGTVGGPKSWSKFKTQPRIAGASRSYKLVPRADQTYGLASWHGTRPEHVLSWSACSILYSGVSGSQTQHTTASQIAGKSGLCSVGNGTKLYWKGRVVLDLASPNLIVPSELVSLSDCLIGGAAMDRRRIYIAATRGLFGSTGAYPESVGNYSAYFIQLPYRITTRNGIQTLTVGKAVTLLGTYDWTWFAENLPAIRAKAEEAHGGQGSALDGAYRTISAYYNVPLPISGWHYDVTGRKACCTFIDSEAWVDLTTANYVMTFDADAADKITVDPRLILFSATLGRWENGEGQRLPGGGEIYDDSFSSATTVYGVSGSINNGFETESTTNWQLQATEPRCGLVIQAGYDGAVPVTAELQVSEYVSTSTSSFSVLRADDLSPFVISGDTNTTHHNKTDLIFYRDGIEVARCPWVVRNASGARARAGGVTTLTGQVNWNTHPLAVLFLDANSQTAVWIELWLNPVLLPSYSTPDVAVQHPTFGVEYVPYTINPTSIETRLYLRKFVRGTEETPVLLREASYPLADPPVVAKATAFGPTTSSSSPLTTQGFWTAPQGRIFWSSFGSWRRSEDSNCPPFASSSIHGSGATFFDAVMWSARPSSVDLDAAVLAAAKLDEYDPIDLGAPTVTLHPAFESYLTSGDPKALAGIGGYDDAWFQNISIY